MKKKPVRKKSNQKISRKSSGTNKGTSGMQREYYIKELLKKRANK